MKLQLETERVRWGEGDCDGCNYADDGWRTGGGTGYGDGFDCGDGGYSDTTECGNGWGTDYHTNVDLYGEATGNGVCRISGAPIGA